MTHRVLTLGLLFWLAGCYEGNVAEQTDAGAEPSLPQPSKPPKSPKSPPPKAAADAGDPCLEAASLVEWCERHACPMQRDIAGSFLCENQQPDRSLSAAELAPPHLSAENSCSGSSVLHYARGVETRYDYDAKGVLIGVTVTDAVGFAECEQTSYTYGKTCSITAPATDRLCGVSCPSIACTAGIQLKFDAREAPAVYENAQIELCQNASCSMGQLISDIDEHANYGIGVFNANMKDGSLVSLTFWPKGPNPYLELGVETYDSSKVKDGDRYAFKLRRRDGSKLYEWIQTIERYDVNEVGAPCTQYCKRKNFDLRGMSDADAGAP